MSTEVGAPQKPQKKRRRIGLLGRIVIAIVLGIILGQFLPAWVAQIFATFNSIFSQFLGFTIPLIIVGLVTPEPPPSFGPDVL